MSRLGATVAGLARGGPLRTAVLVVAVLAVIAAGTAGWYGISWYRAAHDESLELATTRDIVLRQAQQAAINLNTLDHQRVEQGLALWVQSSTGPVLDELRANRKTYAEAITRARSKTEARIVDGAVAELDLRAGTARVLVGLDVTSMPEQGEPTCRRQRLQLEMARTDAGWKVSNVGPVGGAPTPVPGACAAAQPGSGPPK
ncbi:MAG: hypothetical protein ACRDT0_20120 [Pseudonocardiaceae bacterium]